MKLTKAQREEIRMMFGGFCAYCGVPLTGKWHVDHVAAVWRGGGWVKIPDESAPMGYTHKYRGDGKLGKPENDRMDNLFPACVKCNILKAAADFEGLRTCLAYFAESIPRIKNYAHVHHLMRFGKIHIDTEPVIFWFEKCTKEQP